MAELKELARQVVRQADSNVEGLIRLVTDDRFPGASAIDRVRWILKVTDSDLPGMQMGLFPHDDSGFRFELADHHLYTNPEFWADFVREDRQKTKQVGHFLTAVGLRLNRWPHLVKLRLIVGHELLGDGIFLSFLRQFLAARRLHQRLFLLAVAHDEAGEAERRDAALQCLFGTAREALRDRRRIGNSLPDLRLSVKGWRFAEALQRGAVRTRPEAAAWLEREIFDPARVRGRAASHPHLVQAPT
jgi:hypothetical protein